MTAGFATADLFDAAPDAVTIWPLELRDYGGRARFHGVCATMRFDGDYDAARALLGEPGRGRVALLDACGDRTIAVVGDRLAGLAQASGWEGIIVNGAIRDSAACAKLNIGIRALATIARRGSGGGGAVRDVPVRMGECDVRPGMWIYADEDSILHSMRPLTKAGE